MALKACKECGKEISSDAKVCPHCGKKKTSIGCLGGIIVVVFCIIVFSVVMSSVHESPGTNTNGTQSKSEQEEPLTTKGGAVKKKHPAWSNEMCNVVGEQKIRIGMIPEQAIAAWGKPRKVNESVGAWGNHEQWVYNSQYLYFENGVLKSFQSPR